MTELTGHKIKSLSSETPNADESKGSILCHHHAFLIVLTNTFNCLIFKSLPAFVAYIMMDYSFSYSFIVSALSIGSLSTAFTFLGNPLILHLPTNAAFCIFQLFQCLSCFLLWYFRDSKCLFIIGVIIACYVENGCFGCSNTVISTFVNDTNISHKYLSALNAGWTIATFLFFGVGYLMQIGSIWFYLEILFIAFLITAILNLLLLPSISTNKYNLHISNANLPKESQMTVSIKSDLSVLFKIKSFWIIMITLIFTFTAWGYFYSSFGLWLKQLFDLNQAQFGYIAGLAEGFGNLFGILSVAYLAKSDDDDDEENKNYKISLQAMMLWTGLIMLISMVIIFTVIFIGWYNEIFIFIIIGFYFYGQEAAVCSALILMVNVVPSLQQARASSMIGIVQSFTVFTAQLTVSKIYDFGAMKFESFMLIIIYLITMLDIIYLNRIMKEPKLHLFHKMDIERIPINKDKKNIQKYT